jgi:hypothetical protein
MGTDSGIVSIFFIFILKFLQYLFIFLLYLSKIVSFIALFSKIFLKFALTIFNWNSEGLLAPLHSLSVLFIFFFDTISYIFEVLKNTFFHEIHCSSEKEEENTNKRDEA